jgi:hypothetical protein
MFKNMFIVKKNKLAFLSLIFSCFLSPEVLAGGPDDGFIDLGLYIGVGGTWNSIDMWNNLRTYQGNPNAGYDVYANVKDSGSRLAPMAQIGYAQMIDDVWSWGIQFQYKYLNYNLPTIAGIGQVPNDDPTAECACADLSVNLQNEWLMMVYFGGMWNRWYFSLGVGPSVFSMRDDIRYYPADFNGFTDVNKSTYLWGGGAQLGVNYYFTPKWFVGANYTYLITVASMFSNNINQEYFNTGTADGTTNAIFSRNYSFTVQEVMFTLNRVISA